MNCVNVFTAETVENMGLFILQILWRLQSWYTVEAVETVGTEETDENIETVDTAETVETAETRLQSCID